MKDAGGLRKGRRGPKEQKKSLDGDAKMNEESEREEGDWEGEKKEKRKRGDNNVDNEIKRIQTIFEKKKGKMEMLRVMRNLG